MTVASALKSNDRLAHPAAYKLWDFAGVDGLQVAIALFSTAASHLAPFQSLSAEFEQQSCSLLRLCENNFRVRLPSSIALDQAVRDRGLNVWVNPCPTNSLILPPSQGIKRLTQQATTKPIYTLTPFPMQRAVPARIDGVAILAWHHSWQGQPQLLIQTAKADLERVRRALENESLGA